MSCEKKSSTSTTLNTHSHAHAREEMVRICATLRCAGTRRGQRTALCSVVESAVLLLHMNPTNHTAPHPPTLQNPMLWKQLVCRGPIHLGHTHCRSAATETLSGFAFSSSSEEIMMLSGESDGHTHTHTPNHPPAHSGSLEHRLA